MKQAVNMRRFQPDDDLVEIARSAPGRKSKCDPRGMDVTIYTVPPSLCSQRVRMTLLEKGVPYREHIVQSARGENLEPAYIALNPRALVPTMKFGDRVIFDSATIIRFVNNFFDGPELAPSDTSRFTAMNKWIDRSDDFPIRGFTYRAHLADGLPDYWRASLRDNIFRARDLYPQYRELYDLKLADWNDLEAWLASSANLTEGESIAAEMADDAEDALGTGPFLLGQDISLADITLFILFIRLQCGCGLKLCSQSLRPAVFHWMQALKRRTSYDVAVLEPYRKAALVEMTGDCWLPATAVAA